MKGSIFAASLIGFMGLIPMVPMPEGTTFMETRLCASGRILRIELPGQKDPEKQTPMPCHAVCVRDHNPLKKKKAVVL